MIYEVEIRVTDASNLNPHFFYYNPQEMFKAIEMIIAQGYEVIVREVPENE